MGLYNNIVFALGLSPEECVGGDTVTLCQGRGLLVEGHRGVFYYSAERITVSLKKGKLEITGCDMEIVEISLDELYVRGKIECIARSD